MSHTIAQRLRLLPASLAAALLLGACNGSPTLDRSTAAKVITDYLAGHGNLCLNKVQWPIDVPLSEMPASSRNAVQLPVLERLHLVTSTPVTIVQTEDGQPHTLPGRRYALTAEGQRYYLHKTLRVRAQGGDPVERPGDFCAATLSLDGIVGWSPMHTVGKEKVSTVTYTYRVQAAPWMKDAEARHVFPMVARVIDGANAMQLKEDLVLTKDGWKARD